MWLFGYVQIPLKQRVLQVYVFTERKQLYVSEYTYNLIARMPTYTRLQIDSKDYPLLVYLIIYNG